MGVYCSALDRLVLPDRRLRPTVRARVGPPPEKAPAVKLRDASTNTVSDLVYFGQPALVPGVVQALVKLVPSDEPVVALDQAGNRRRVASVPPPVPRRAASGAARPDEHGTSHPRHRAWCSAI